MPALGFQDTYLALPESVRAEISREEWAWLPDAEKHDLLYGATMPPDDAEDGAE